MGGGRGTASLFGHCLAQTWPVVRSFTEAGRPHFLAISSAQTLFFRSSEQGFSSYLFAGSSALLSCPAYARRATASCPVFHPHFLFAYCEARPAGWFPPPLLQRAGAASGRLAAHAAAAAERRGHPRPRAGLRAPARVQPGREVCQHLVFGYKAGLDFNMATDFHSAQVAHQWGDGAPRRVGGDVGR